MAKIANTIMKASKRLSYDEMRMLELLMTRYAAAQTTHLTAEEAWAEFCDGKCEFITLGYGENMQIGVAPVRGVARLSAAIRHKVKFKALQEARKRASLKGAK